MVDKNKKTRTSLNLSYKVIKNGKVIDRYRTRSKRRFLYRARTINWKKKHLKVYLRVSYGKHLTNYGKLDNFWNDGEYRTKKEFWIALRAFLED